MRSRTRRKLTIYLESDLSSALSADAHHRGLAVTRAAADALRRIYLDEKDEAVANTVKMRLDRVEKREIARGRDLAIIKETLLLFIRVWLEHTPAPEDEAQDALHALAEQRFEAFLELLAESLQPGRRLFADAPHARSELFNLGASEPDDPNANRDNNTSTNADNSRAEARA